MLPCSVKIMVKVGERIGDGGVLGNVRSKEERSSSSCMSTLSI